MSLLWLLPALITLAGAIPVIMLVREAIEEAERTRRAISAFRGLRPAVVELRSEVDATREAWVALQQRQR